MNGIQADRVRLTPKNYFVRGTTALYDAIGKTINEVGNRLSNTGEEERPAKVIFVITTDGLENASCEFDYEKVQSMIRHQQEVYDWEFMFMGANIDAVKEAEMIGISNGNAFNFQASSEGISEMYNDICEKVSSFRFSEID
ncbi:VWA domain-containing protein [Pullulanibacillus sp. KACC 23026]|uniref:VWA domain-containing protein n=1 Tax=Pullulanibacillus sp. KACC 23026 TaxID=3028315 RepID=UPI0023B0934C|nr:VWA domain-containing protein [Pullulanibacillus sp. KACC 23026]WEG14418.1 VWA domain-containing protein [Pullulanibacillus sp. KACC 23026]